MNYTVCDTELTFSGPPLSSGPLPLIVYFALSGTDTLNLSPFNHPLSGLKEKGIEDVRFVSWDIPFHTKGEDPNYALKQWSCSLETGHDFLTPFLDLSTKILDHLIEQKVTTKKHVGLMGLSRGGFLAGHLAARLAHVKSITLFAPLVTLETLHHTHPYQIHLPSLEDLKETLVHKELALYIGNLDERVDVDRSVQLVRSLARLAKEKRQRHYPYTLHLTPSIGHKGHGTEEHIFKEGALWLYNRLMHKEL